jgi:hypothetical protein
LIRKTKKSALTETALAGIRAEANKAGLTMDEALAMCCTRGWQSFRADWVKPEDRKAAQPQSESFRERDERLARERYEEATGQRSAPPAPSGFVVDVTPAPGKFLGA